MVPCICYFELRFWCCFPCFCLLKTSCLLNYLREFPPPCSLITSCSLNYFERIFPPVRLLHPVLLIDSSWPGSRRACREFVAGAASRHPPSAVPRRQASRRCCARAWRSSGRRRRAAAAPGRARAERAPARGTPRSRRVRGVSCTDQHQASPVYARRPARVDRTAPARWYAYRMCAWNTAGAIAHAPYLILVLHIKVYRTSASEKARGWEAWRSPSSLCTHEHPSCTTLYDRVKE